MNAVQARFSHVLITRPQAEAEHLAGMLASLALKSIVQPAQTFNARALGDSELEELSALPSPALVIFTSTRAVEFGLPQLPAALLAHAKIAAVGPATASALAAAGKQVDVAPQEGHSSESLLEALGESGLRGGGTAVVLCAPGGREILFERLGDYGWTARPVWVYQRRAAELSADSIKAIADADRLLTVFTSAQAMESLSQRLPPSAWYAVCRAEWLVISSRLRQLARAYGPPEVHLANGPRNADLASAIRSLT